MGPTGAKGTTGAKGATGARGPTGPSGRGGAHQILFNRGGLNVGNGHFVGIADEDATEIKVQQIVAAAGSATTMRCFSEDAPAVNITFTLRKNGADTALTCTILAGQTSGSGSGSASWVAGDLLDVRAPAAGMPNKIASFAIS
jgi:hypothetical protein